MIIVLINKKAAEPHPLVGMKSSSLIQICLVNMLIEYCVIDSMSIFNVLIHLYVI